MEKAGIYIHIPFCKRKCNYCAFVSVCDFSLMKPYVQALKREIEGRANGQMVDTIYFGGGTPSVLYRGAITEILQLIREKFVVQDDAEITVEANPESASQEFFKECKTAGVTRISMGLQSSCDEILKDAGRIHSVQMYENALDAMRKIGKFNVSADLMYGFKNQTLASVLNDVDYVCSKNVDHVSIYALSIEEGTPFEKIGYTVDEDFQADVYQAIVDRLRTKGYYRYEISNFAKDGKYSRHNSKYWTGAEYFGFGVSAHSLVCNQRIENVESIEEYICGNVVKNSYFRSKYDIMEERIMLSMRMANGIDLRKFEKEFGFSLFEKKKKQIIALKDAGLLQEEDEYLKLTNEGYFVMNSIIANLMPYEEEVCFNE